jgi:hypothetical protein
VAFNCDDLEELSAAVAAAWRTGIDRDWSAPAGTLAWTCAHTADHTVDTVFAPAAFLASRRRDSYPAFGVASAGAASADLIEGLETATRILVAVVNSAPPTVSAVIWRGENRPPHDFPARAGLELILHAHDVCSGLGVDFRPPQPLCERLRRHTDSWPMWGAAGWSRPSLSGNAWEDLLHASGR